MFTAHCSGCELPREGQVSLQPGDHITVTFTGLTEGHLKAAGRHVQHSSMDQLRANVPLTLFNCFEAFTQRSDHFSIGFGTFNDYLSVGVIS